MTDRVRGVLAQGAAMLVASALVAPVAGAQTLTHTTSTVSVAAPTEATYDAQSASGFSGTYTLTTTCTGSGSNGCRLFVANGSNGTNGPITLQFQVVGTTGGSTCHSNVALNTPTDVTAPGGTAIATSTKNDACTFSIQFRVKAYNYVTYQAPGPYTQNVTFNWTRP